MPLCKDLDKDESFARQSKSRISEFQFRRSKAGDLHFNALGCKEFVISAKVIIGYC